MKAAVLNTRKGPLDIEEIQIDKPGPREVLLRTAASGVCASDLKLIDAGMPGGAAIVPATSRPASSSRWVRTSPT